MRVGLGDAGESQSKTEEMVQGYKLPAWINTKELQGVHLFRFP